MGFVLPNFKIKYIKPVAIYIDKLLFWKKCREIINNTE